MGNFNFIETDIKGLYIVEPKVFGDNRGFFLETYSANAFKEAGLDMEFVQDNHSKSKKGVLRGMHFQSKHSQGKLVRVTKGEVYDVAVDLRKNSPTYGKWQGVYLSEENKRMFYVPEGFAHGFLVTSEEAEFLYKCTDFYHPEFEGSLMWNDPAVGIQWPLDNIEEVLLSDKDKKGTLLKDLNLDF